MRVFIENKKGSKVKLSKLADHYLGSGMQGKHGVITGYMPDYYEKLECEKSGTVNTNNCSCWQRFEITLDSGEVLRDIFSDEFEK